MLKLIIADDERIIRETIYQIINWKKYNIEVIGLCSNGSTTYDMILDTSPDIVMTDVKMPGLNGLELIKKATEANLCIQFIILSGYSEFEYAKEAMKYGVKHYLLKPCNELQIEESLNEIIYDCYTLKTSHHFNGTDLIIANNICYTILNNIIVEIIETNKKIEEILVIYEPYIDFYHTNYLLFSINDLIYTNLLFFLEELKSFKNYKFTHLIIHGTYINNKLLLFFEGYKSNKEIFNTFIEIFKLNHPYISFSINHKIYTNLYDLLNELLLIFTNSSIIYYIYNFHVIPTYNYHLFIEKIDTLYKNIITQNDSTAFDNLILLLEGITDINFFKQITNNLLIKIITDIPAISTIEIIDCLLSNNKLSDLNTLKQSTINKLQSILYSTNQRQIEYSGITDKVIAYVIQNLKDPNLTLKLIAEQYLFMNVDYLSKRFYKETGIKFSTFLTNTRIKKSQDLIISHPDYTIREIADQVGFSNNPQYFSQIFKKVTGITPSKFISNLGNYH